MSLTGVKIMENVFNFNKENFLALVAKSNKEMVEINQVVKPTNEKEKQIADYIYKQDDDGNTPFGCQTRAVVDMLNIALDLHIVDNNVEYCNGVAMAMVVLDSEYRDEEGDRNPNDHDYYYDKPILILRGGEECRGLMMNNHGLGNTMHLGSKDNPSFKMASDEEIEEFLNDFSGDESKILTLMSRFF